MLPVVTSGMFDAKRFYYRRAHRILPPYYMAALLSLILGALYLNGFTQPVTTLGVLSHLFLVHNVHEQTMFQIDGPLWSVALECQIYLLFPLLIAIRRRFGLLALLGSTYVVALPLQLAVAGTVYRGLMPIYLFVFALGMTAAELAMGPRKPIFVWLWIGSTLTVLMAWTHPAPWYPDVDAMVGVSAMSFMVVCAHWPRSVLARPVSWRPVSFLGTFSYSLYLIHFPLQQVLIDRLLLPHLGKMAACWTATTIGTLVVGIISYGFYLLIEKPFLNKPPKTVPVSESQPVQNSFGKKEYAPSDAG